MVLLCIKVLGRVRDTVPESCWRYFRNFAMDVVEICNVCTRKAIIKVAERMFNSDKI